MTAFGSAILLYNGECAVCRRISIRDDPEALLALTPDLDIWEAYRIIHLLMPGGEMKTGGEAVAEVLRSLPNCRWFAWTFRMRILGLRPFQGILNLCYTILAETRPLLGCASCGIPNPWVGAIASVMGAFGGSERASQTARLSPRARTVTNAG